METPIPSAPVGTPATGESPDLGSPPKFTPVEHARRELEQARERLSSISKERENIAAQRKALQELREQRTPNIKTEKITPPKLPMTGEWDDSSSSSSEEPSPKKAEEPKPKKVVSAREIYDAIPNPMNYPRTLDGLAEWVDAFPDPTKYDDTQAAAAALEARLRTAIDRWPSSQFGSVFRAIETRKASKDKPLTVVPIAGLPDNYGEQLEEEAAAIRKEYEGKLSAQQAMDIATYLKAREEYDAKVAAARKHLHTQLLPKLGIDKAPADVIKYVYSLHNVPSAPRKPSFLWAKKKIVKEKPAKKATKKRGPKPKAKAAPKGRPKRTIKRKTVDFAEEVIEETSVKPTVTEVTKKLRANTRRFVKTQTPSEKKKRAARKIKV